MTFTKRDLDVFIFPIYGKIKEGKQMKAVIINIVTDDWMIIDNEFVDIKKEEK